MSGEVKVVLTTDQLEQAFYHLTDILDRCLCPVMLAGETLRSIEEDNIIKGDGVYVMVRQSDFTNDTLSTMMTLATPGLGDINLGMDNFRKTDRGYEWEYKNVPIVIQIVKRKYSWFSNPDYIFYMGEEYKVPNPWKMYWKARYIVQ
jgi:hypothetical protein